MSDIVDRLVAESSKHGSSKGYRGCIEAAETIARLRAELRELAGAVSEAHDEDCDCPRVKVGYVDCPNFPAHKVGKHDVPPCDPAGACCACRCGESESP